MALSAAVPSTATVQPDIGYKPDYEKYIERSKRRQETESLKTSLPPGFPKELKSSLVWEGHNVGEKFDWTYELNAIEVEEIEKALRHFKGKLFSRDTYIYISQEL
jgi:hypothetical protein